MIEYWDEAARAVIVVSCLVLSGLLIRSARRGWKTWSSRTKDHWWFEFMWTFSVGVFGTLEALLMHAPGGSRLLLGLFTCYLGFRAVLGRGSIEVEKR